VIIGGLFALANIIQNADGARVLSHHYFHITTKAIMVSAADQLVYLTLDRNTSMLILFSYPKMWGLHDNNPYGLKVHAFLRLVELEYQTQHIIDTKDAPRRKLPYIIDNYQKISDSNYIIDYLTTKHGIEIDIDLSTSQLMFDFLIKRTLEEHLYWVMSYSRWQDLNFWPLFKSQFLREFPQATSEDLELFREYNIRKYNNQGIGRYEAHEVYKEGVKDLEMIAALLDQKDFMFGDRPHVIDACIYGFIANIYFFEIDTPLRMFVLSNSNLSRHCERIHQLVK